MKYTEFEINNHKIEFLNSLFGKETICLNGRKVSEKYSITGTNHDFRMDNESFQILSTHVLFHDSPIKLDLVKDQQIIYSTSCKINLRHKIIWMVMGIAIVFTVATLLT